MKNNCPHRVGSITAAISLIGFGILYLLNILLNTPSYSFICKLSPVILIFLGVELLITNALKKDIVFDGVAILLLLFLLGLTFALLIFGTILKYNI